MMSQHVNTQLHSPRRRSRRPQNDEVQVGVLCCVWQAD